MEACASRSLVNIYRNVFKKIYVRPTRHLCSKKEDKSGPSDVSSSDSSDAKVKQTLSKDITCLHVKGEERNAVQTEAIKSYESSGVAKDSIEGHEDQTTQAKLLSALTDIKVKGTHGWSSTFNISLAKPPKRLGRRNDPDAKKEKELAMQLRIGYGKDMASAVKAVASSLGGDVEKTEQELVETLTKGLPAEEPVENVTESADVKAEASMDEVSKNMMSAVEAVASTIAGDTENVESELTKKLMSLAAEKGTIDLTDMSEVVEGMKVDKKEEDTRRRRVRQTTVHRKVTELQVDLFGVTPLNVFKLENKDAPQESSQMLWNELEKKELRSLVQYAPANPYEEMIQWTEQGKLWTFPINNEAGMHEEENVGFHEHVFLDSYLQEGFPKKGPIRHFMDLVVVGLSKNPYMSVQRKIEHINWYREYFNKEINREILEQYEAAA